MKSFFENLLGKKRKQPAENDQPPVEEQDAYKPGDVIGGKYEVQRPLGRGGFGVVYLAFNRQTKTNCALKTFRDELISNPTAREAFKKEALVWLGLEDHPFILTARWVEEFSGRLFVEMDYVGPDAEGRVHLGDYLVSARPLDDLQTLTWAIQFCLGMEHANSHGIECHRDIKPANILIARDATLKISDFGLAAAAEAAWREHNGHGRPIICGDGHLTFGMSLIKTQDKKLCGTPGYMPPEVLRGERPDRRSDIYSFGLVLWQMSIGSAAPPFLPRWRGDMDAFLHQIHERQIENRLPRIHSPLQPVIERCLSPERAKRFSTFEDLRRVLESIWLGMTGHKFEHPQVAKQSAGFWSNKGESLNALGKHEDAIYCFDQALALDPQYATSWSGKGMAMAALKRFELAIHCYDKALEITTTDPFIWNNKGISLAALGRPNEAIRSYDNALAIDRHYANAWHNKGLCLAAQERPTEAIACFEEALRLDTKIVQAWVGKGNCLTKTGRNDEALACYEKAVLIDPLHSDTWYDIGLQLARLGLHENAITYFDKALDISPQRTDALNNKGGCLAALSRKEEAMLYYERTLAIDPDQPNAWSNKGLILAELGRLDEAIRCYSKALGIDARCSEAWFNMALAEDSQGRRGEAIDCYRKFIGVAPPRDLKLVERARKRLQELRAPEN